MTPFAILLSMLPWLWAEGGREPAPVSPPPAAEADFEPGDIDRMLSQMRKEGSWSVTLMETPGRKITFVFGELGKRVVELKWARQEGASLGEVKDRLDAIYERGSDAEGEGGPRVGRPVLPGGPTGESRKRQAFEEAHRAVDSLNRRRLKEARNHLTLLEAAAAGVPEAERTGYEQVSRSLRWVHALLSADESLRHLVLAAQRSDFASRGELQRQLQEDARTLGLDISPYMEVAARIWDAYAGKRAQPKPSGRQDLDALLKELDRIEKMVQGPFRRADYVSAMEALGRRAAGLSGKDRKVLAKRLRRHAAMWNKAAAETLAFAMLAELSGDAKLRGEKATLLDRSRWQGEQGARAQSLARQLVT